MKEVDNFHIFELSNGLKVVHKQTDRPVAHCGVFINAGTRDELEGEHGLAHFIEHALFKGTKNRRSYHILNRLDSVGGELDAFTTKEMTCIYASFLTEYYDRSIELLADVILNSTFPEKELEKEKEVILDEILVYQDSPSDQIYDDFESQVFEGHSLGNQILGSKESVLNLSRKDIFNYQHRLYKASNMVLSSVGNISVKKLERLLNKYFSNLSSAEKEQKRESFIANPARKENQKRGTNQAHLMMGKSSFGLSNPKRVSLSLLNNLFGGPAMNSILNLKIREKFGYTYHLESNYTPYSDSGLFSIYLATDPKYLNKCIQHIFKEMKKLRTIPLSNTKLHMAKQQLKGQIAIGRENNTSLMLSYGKSLLMNGHVKRIEEIHERIDQVSSEEIQAVAMSEFDESNFHILTYND